MPIRIKRGGGGYSAEVTPPHGRDSTWASSSPMKLDVLIERLRSLGCHQTDIADALNLADPNWLTRIGP